MLAVHVVAVAHLGERHVPQTVIVECLLKLNGRAVRQQQAEDRFVANRPERNMLRTVSGDFGRLDRDALKVLDLVLAG